MTGLGATIALLALFAADFESEVWPVFQRSCLMCHGPKSQMAGLRLDSKQLAGRTIQPGNAAGSSLYQRITGAGEQARMPMGMKPLAPGEIAKIKEWIDAGAAWPAHLDSRADVKKHWAYVPPRKTNPPRPGHPVDAFVRAKLERENLKPAPPADRVTLLRRLSLDLIGLPPTPEEVDRFVADRAPDAYRKQVERLLASPHYGERWARWWLDAARYADSDGYEKDKQRNVWFYRDWVIQALNRDLPYNQFLTEQLAGDLLPNATQDQRVATGFLRNSMINEEGGVDPEQFRMEAMFDRMDAMGKAMLGVTIQCAQCHNHKFDPLTQEEYYRLFAFLNNSSEGSIAVYTPAEQQKRAEVLGKIRAIEDELKHRTPDWQARFTAWQSAQKTAQPAWRVVQPAVDDISTGGQRYLPLEDGSLLAAGYAPTKHTVKLTLPGGSARSFRLELLNHPDLPFTGPGRSPKGTAALTEFEVEYIPAGAEKPLKAKVASASADLNLAERELDPIYDDKSKKRRVTGPIDFAIDGKVETAWGIDAGPVLRNQPRTAVFVLAEPITNAKSIVVHLSQRHGGWNSDDNQSHNLGRFRLSVADAEAAAQPELSFAAFRATVAGWKQANEEITRLWAQHPEGTSQLVLAERDRMRSTHLLLRGDFLKPGKVVEPGTPAFLNPWPESAPRNRLGLAQWLSDRNAPTTARSLVNRVWQAYFGTGLVASSEDLGKQSETPSHPELLDWLAADFMEKSWSLKALHRTIVLSATYQQSSKVTPEMHERDPDNRLLARGPRFRVDAEIVRDIALAASGLLDGTVGGPSVYPPAPSFLFEPPASYGPKNWHEAKDASRYRRALYTFRYRSVPYPVLQNFDAPNGDMACVRRARSNTPLQALTTLNEPLFLEAAQALGERARKAAGSDRDRLAYVFRLCVARRPEAAELAALEQFHARHQNWTATARVILNLDETITKE